MKRRDLLERTGKAAFVLGVATGAAAGDEVEPAEKPIPCDEYAVCGNCHDDPTCGYTDCREIC